MRVECVGFRVNNQKSFMRVISLVRLERASVPLKTFFEPHPRFMVTSNLELIRGHVCKGKRVR